MVRNHARIIISYGRRHGSNLTPYLPPDFTDFLIDSGGFQIHQGTSERDITVQAYSFWLNSILKRYGEYGKGGVVRGYFGLDTADWVETQRNYDYMKSKGLNPIPVWKAFWPESFLDALCEEYPWVAVGGIAFGGSKVTLRRIFERIYVRHPTTKFHMLGVGIRGGIAFKTFRAYSVDVSTWGVPARFGHDIIFDSNQVLKEVKLPDHLRKKLRESKEFEDEMIEKAIKLIQSLETELDKINDPRQNQMEI